ncbi:hypothetical protein CLV47_11837 [Antricoccus suffuscus]|uniref:LppP/LprE lipoprotein n=1 Tax=Antricoccus suffuscus TaxID=1629062 RepID=A0A2T0ZTM5_9ACTN|nr:hypothetical protein [Antricoccus suffuscus]PRZ39673.1 hypothetical protein CLV47_11837 [Antricoccus suffuscus]
MRGKLAAAVLSALLAISLAACSDDDPGTGNGGSGGSSAQQQKAGAPDQSDGRKLADWAATKMVTRHTTDICMYGTQELEKRFGKQGWCENDPTFKQTAVTLDLVGTCDATQGGSKTPPGDLYLYRVEPSIEFDPDAGTESGVQVTVLKQGNDYKINSIVTKSVSDDLMTPDCPDGHADPASGSITLG